MFQGVFTALVTPFTKKNSVDYSQLRDLVDMQIAAGVAGLVPVGTTGESPTLSPEEAVRVIQIVVEQSAKRVPVIAGAGSNSTDTAVKLTKIARDLGADAALQVVPYYNKPTQKGLIEHFLATADAADIPIVLYDVPGRSAVGLDNDSIATLARHKNIIGIKTACGSISQIMDLIDTIPEGFDILSGDDNLVFPLMMLGGGGVISVVSNLYPRRMVELCDACLNRQWETARTIHYRMLPIFKAAFIESNPIPVKAAMAMKGYLEEIYRRPLGTISSEHRKELVLAVAQVDASFGS